MNELYPMPPIPEGVEDGILKGIYKYKVPVMEHPKARAHLLGSGAILNETIKAAEILESRYSVAADIWSITSYKELYTDGLETDRWNMLHPGDEPKKCYLQRCFSEDEGVFVAASDYLKSLPCSIAKWLPGRLVALGTDGYGRSDTREALRDYFEVDARHIALATLQALVAKGSLELEVAEKAVTDLDVDPEKVSAVTV
jgi:pyruvate dehydrogenase E1 component